MGIKAVVVHSGGMDSSICLAVAMKKFGADQLLSLSFNYGQRHQTELAAAAYLCASWGVAHQVVSVTCLQQLSSNALMQEGAALELKSGGPASSFVVGRNGLFARLAAMRAHELGASVIYLGVMEMETENSGYPDCRRVYMDALQDLLRIDLLNLEFKIETPLVSMTKAETMALADQLGVLPELLQHSVTCYRGIKGPGCGDCPSCHLRATGLKIFQESEQTVTG